MKGTTMKHPLTQLLCSIGALACVGINPATAADAGAAATDPCADIASLPQDDPKLGEQYDQIRKLCIARKINAISTLTKTEKYTALAAALSGLGSIPGNTGTISQMEKTSHLGDLQSQQTLYEAAEEVGRKLDKTAVMGTGSAVMLLTDSAAMQQRISVLAATAQFNEMQKTLTQLGNALAETPLPPPSKAKPVPGKSTAKPLFAAPVILPLIPPLISAVQALASLGRSDAALFGLAPHAQKEVIWAGLCEHGCAGLVVPGSNVSVAATATPFQKAYSDLAAAAQSARKVLAKTQGAIQKAGGDKKVSDGILVLRDATIAQLAEFDELDKTLRAVQVGKTTTLLEDLAQADFSTYGPGGTLLVTIAEFGGHGGTVSRKWPPGKNDQLVFETTAALSYVLFAPDGTVKTAGFVAKGHTTTRDSQETGLAGKKPEAYALLNSPKANVAPTREASGRPSEAPKPTVETVTLAPAPVRPGSP